MNIEISVTITDPDGTAHDHVVAAFDKSFEASAEIGLSIAESKALLLKLQQEIVSAQTRAFCAKRAVCPSTGKKLRTKGHRPIRYRTVFGDILIHSPRFYRRPCTEDGVKTFSPLTELLPDHVAPEMLWLETKWTSLVSYGATAALLKDVLPIGEGLGPETLRRHLTRVAARMETDLGAEQYSFVETSMYQREKLPIPEAPITVGIDGGYVRSREPGQSHFEVTVGKSIADRSTRYLGLVQSHDDKPKRRLNTILKDQGWKENQSITFMTDGADNLLNIARDMAPASEHLLDWFHITMRITVMGQYVKGLAHHNPDEADVTGSQLRRVKGFLWNGNLHDGQAAIDDLIADLEDIETGYESIKALRKAANEFQTYIANAAWMIPNYAERRRYGERVSTGFVESTVNTVVGKRFGKRQQMRWSKAGAHHMLQIRTRTLDGTLRSKFEQWYPGMKSPPDAGLAA